MGFSCSLTTDKMVLYILGNFKWYRREVAFPPRPLPFDYEELYPNFVLAEAEDDLEEEESLGSDDQIPSPMMAVRSEAWPATTYGDTEEMTDHAMETFKWQLRRVSHPPPPLPEDYRDLCSSFTFPDAEEAVHDFNIPAWHSGGAASPADSSRGWSWACEQSGRKLGSLLENHHDLCPNFDLLMAIRYAHNSCIPDMMQAIFYAMVLNDAAELGLSSRIAVDCMICEYSSTPSILSIEEDVVYLWEIDVAVDRILDFQERRMAKTTTTARLRSPDELLAEGTSEGNPSSSSGSHRSNVEVELESASTSSSLEGETRPC
ncbi:hypothetical protein Cgig2_014907 [Carnegiea gigantea]|uniref:Uncharacterized protein n=1 Tax=Carnegiea gigantea TaxID=171969 RepID=A0A9Q1GHU8_9CARY|nr:hypothetical protein Cgig2_014907 [Carnegiea gigantea]